MKQNLEILVFLVVGGVRKATVELLPAEKREPLLALRSWREGGEGEGDVISACTVLESVRRFESFDILESRDRTHKGKTPNRALRSRGHKIDVFVCLQRTS